MAYINARGTFVRLEVDGEFVRIPGMRGITPNQDPATSEEIPSFEGTETITGDLPNPTLAFVGNSNPLHPTVEELRAARDGRQLRVEVEIPTQAEQNLSQASSTVAIAAGGVVTLGGPNKATLNERSPGLVLTQGARRWAILDVTAPKTGVTGYDGTDSTGVVRVKPIGNAPATLNAIGTYVVSIPRMKYGPVICTLLNFSELNVETPGRYTLNIGLQLGGPIPKPVIL